MISDSFSLRVWVDEHVCHLVIQKVTMHDFPEVIMASTFYRVVYPFLHGKRQFTRINGYAYG